MAYHAIANGAPDLAKITKILHRIEAYYLRPVHTLFRLPMGELQDNCQFVIAQTLLSTIASASTTLYMIGINDGERFRNVLIDYYPWETETVTRNEAAKILYEQFRCPIVHDAGVNLRGGPDKAKVLRVIKNNEGLSEERIEFLESRDRPADLAPTLTERDDGVVVLRSEALYWGVRCMVERLTADRERMERAEAALPDHV